MTDKSDYYGRCLVKPRIQNHKTASALGATAIALGNDSALSSQPKI